MAEAPISKKRKRGNPNRKTGLIGVYTNGKKYKAMISYGGTQHSLGAFDTKEEAGMAFDRPAIVINKSTEEVSFTLNYPNMSDHEREVALLPAEPPHKKRKRGKKEENVTCTTSIEDDESSEEESDSSHSSDDDESDEEEADAPTPSPQAPPYFERDPMLDQLFADAQNKKQQQQKQEDQVVH